MQPERFLNQDPLADAFEEWASSQQRVKFQTLAASDATAGLPAVRLLGCDPAADGDNGPNTEADCIVALSNGRVGSSDLFGVFLGSSRRVWARKPDQRPTVSQNCSTTSSHRWVVRASESTSTRSLWPWKRLMKSSELTRSENSPAP